MSELSTRPPRPVVGVEMPHESAELHVTGLALYTDDLVARYPGTLHAYPVQAPHAHATVRSLDPAPALAVPGVVYVLTAARRAGGERRRGQARRATVPRRGHVLRASGVLGAGREPGGGPDRGHAVAVDYDPLPSLVTDQGGHRGGELPGRPAHAAPRRPGGGLRRGGCAHVFEGEFEFAGQEHFYLETNAALASVDENGQIFVQS